MPNSSLAKTALAYGLVGMFALPFCGFGLFAGVTALKEAASPNPDWAHVAYGMMFGLIFGAVGSGFLIALAFGRRKLKAIEALKASYPDSPWMWRADWAKGRVLSKTHSSMVGAWILAVFWNSISWFVVCFGWREIELKMQRKPAVMLVFLFPLVGIGIFIYAVRETLRWLEFGKTWFEMTVPGVIGRSLTGNIQARFPHGAAKGVSLKLSCVNRVVTGSGNSQSTQEKVLWRDEMIVSASALMPSAEGTFIPVRFEVPADALPTDNSMPRDQVLWMLQANADVPGVDYQDFFEIPLFRTKDSPASAQAVDRFNAFSHVPEGPVERPSDSQVKVWPTAAGMCFDFGASRNPGMAAGTTAFFFLWSAVVWFLWGHAPIIFPIFFGLFDVILFFILLSLWAGTSVVTIEGGQVTVKSGFFGIGVRRTIVCSEITDIILIVGMQSGGASGKPYYSIYLECSGRRVEVGGGVKDKLEAEWLVSEMKKAIGLKAKAEAAVSAV